jgi:hypothetical protein
MADPVAPDHRLPEDTGERAALYRHRLAGFYPCREHCRHGAGAAPGMP